MEGNAFSTRTGSSLPLPFGAPDQGARVDLVSEDEVDAVLGPELSGGAGDALVVEGLGDCAASPYRSRPCRRCA